MYKICGEDFVRGGSVTFGAAGTLGLGVDLIGGGDGGGAGNFGLAGVGGGQVG